MIIDILQVGPLAVNCFIVGCEETREGFIVDAGGDAEHVIAAADRRRLNITHVINTHGHFDHVGGNRAVVDYFGAKLLIHEADAPMLKRAADVARSYGLPGDNSPEPDGYLTDGMEIMLGKHKMKVLHTPGHTPGGCSLYFEEKKKLISGDTLFADSIGRTDLPGGSYPQLIESVVSKLFVLPDDVTVYPGHGPATTIGHEKRHNPYF